MASKTEKFITRDQVFNLFAYSLKPSTRHYFYFDGLINGNVKPTGGKLGDPLYTDSSGVLRFDFYYSGTTILDTTGFEQAENAAKNFAAQKTVIISDSGSPWISNTSICFSSIPVVATKLEHKTTPDAIIDIVETAYVPGVISACTSFNNRGGGGCPAPWIQILLEDGTTVAASDLKVGDKVWTQHETTQEWGAFEVCDHQIILDTERWEVELHTGEVFIGSYNHRVKTVNGWLEICDLQRGMEIVTPTETALVLSSKYYDKGDVVMITVTDAHTYISSGILSHNMKSTNFEFNTFSLV